MNTQMTQTNPEVLLLTVAILTFVISLVMIGQFFVLLSLKNKKDTNDQSNKNKFDYDLYQRLEQERQEQSRMFYELKKNTLKFREKTPVKIKVVSNSDNVIDFKKPENNVVSLMDYKSRKGPK